ncbi:DUF6894 family protein [Methylobacterium oryzisoli]|uniref:DUF6894 family protein n=1 Tax=Methylobacterium oryzisoli TaxID=3385502 RepID=UPI0038920436
MPQRFYFDLTDGLTITPDDEGVEAGDLRLALMYAEEAIHEMRLNGELCRIDTNWRFEIRTHSGDILATLPIS